jgi:hypothetical protein
MKELVLSLLILAGPGIPTPLLPLKSANAGCTGGYYVWALYGCIPYPYWVSTC